MNVLFVGFGSIAKKHFDALKILKPEAVVYALRSGKEASDIPGIKNIFSWKEVPSDIAFAIISNPTFKHTDTLTEIVSRNIPVFIEKPIADKLDGLDKLELQIEQMKLHTYVACNLRFLPALQYLKNEILPQCKKVNEVSVYCGSYLPDWRQGINYKENYSAREEMGGGVHLDLFHELDYMSWLFGLPSSSSGILRNRSSLNITAADFANYQLIYSDFVGSITLNYYRLDPKRTIEVVTSDGTFTADIIANKILNGKGEVIFSNSGFSIKDTYLAQMNYFLGTFDRQNLSMNTFSESLKILKICLNAEKIK
jgi:predicted dehydrogenase